MRITIGLFLAAFTLGSLCAFAAEEKPLAPGRGMTVTEADMEDINRPTASIDVSFLNQYIWRGYELSKDSLVIQPSATVSFKGFSLNLWGNLDTDRYSGPYKGEAKWNETDMTVAYATGFGPVDIGVGYLYYALDGVDDTQEFYVSVGGDVLLAPTLTVYRNVDEYQGWYFNLGISHSFDLPQEITLDVAGSAGYYISDNDRIVDYDHNLNATTSRFKNFQDGLVSVGLTIPFLKYFTATPMIAYSFPLGTAADNMLTATSLSNNSAHLFGGMTLSMAF
jgi:hypothetical protein